jgi:3D (Asp-Asp-Asp) domain-containing protein
MSIRIAVMICCCCFINACTSLFNLSDQCSDDWKITGFYTPKENENLSNTTHRINVHKVGQLSFSSKFIAAVKVEGWGKTRFGWYLGYYANRWHKSSTPLNAKGLPLEIGAVAVDNRVIKPGSRVSIPAIEKHIDRSVFIASDVGSGVKNRHVDVYTGEGNNARLKSYLVTGKHQVCTTAKNPAPVEEPSRKCKCQSSGAVMVIWFIQVSLMQFSFH